MAPSATLGSEREYGHLPFVVGPKLVPGPAPKPFERRDQTDFPEHDPEKWTPVFGERSCSNNKQERDDDSKKSHPGLGPRMTPRALENPTILVFDSGLGGLTVYREIARARPDARYVYAADDALFPYGAMEEDRLIARALDLMERLIAEHRPDLVVIACNTASTIVLPSLRARLPVAFVGTVPAIKPACAASKSKRVSVLGTEATVKREYTRALIREFAADCQVTLVGSARLAGLAEAALAGEAVDDAAIAAEIAPCFVADGAARTDTVVLACTHYPLLADRLARLSPWPVNFMDPAPAIARRVVDLIGPARNGHAPTAPEVVFSSGRTPPPALWPWLHGIGRPAPRA